MIAAVWHGPDDLRVEERDRPEALPGTVVVKVKACAVCGSDLRILREGNARITKPRIIGHEIAGEVVEIGDGVENFTLNDRISTGADVPCGECDYCRAGLANSCKINYAIGYQFDGGFAEYIQLDHRVVKYGPVQTFDKTLDWKFAALAEPLGCCINGFEQALAEYKKPQSVVVFGAGPIGLMLMKLARKIYGVETIIAVEPTPLRRQKAIEIGANVSLNPSEDDVVSAVFDLTSGKGADLVFTACPVLQTHIDALEIVAPNGVINFFGGIGKAEPPLSILSNYIHYKQIYLTGSHGSTPAQHKTALSYIEQGLVSVDDIISHEFNLEDVIDGFALASSGKASKVIITP